MSCTLDEQMENKYSKEMKKKSHVHWTAHGGVSQISLHSRTECNPSHPDILVLERNLTDSSRTAVAETQHYKSTQSMIYSTEVIIKAIASLDGIVYLFQ